MQIDNIPKGSNNTMHEWLSRMTKGGTDRMNSFNNIFEITQEFTIS